MRKETTEVMRAMGRLGGKRRLKTLSPETRREIARNAAKVRWARLGKDSVAPVRSLDFSRELQWLLAHRRKYAGKWVALQGDRLLASGPNAREVYQAARRAGVKVPFVDQVPAFEETPFAGW